jgi:uncharacterized protein YodC (DUF2158 family)
MAAKFTIGDIVRLKSGGPWTTVTKDKPEAGSKFVQISWFDGSKLESHVLPKVTLEHDPARMAAEEKVTTPAAE